MRKLHSMIVVLLTMFFLTGCGEDPYTVGMEMLEAGEYNKAAEGFKESINREKNIPDSYLGLGISLWEEKEYEGAMEALEQALLLGTKETAAIYNLMGNCAMQLEQYDVALQNYEKALSMEDISDELKREVRYNQIAAYEHTADIDTIKEIIAAYLADYPDDEDVLREFSFWETR